MQGSGPVLNGGETMNCGEICEQIAKMLLAMSGYKIALGLFFGWLSAIFIGKLFADFTNRIQKRFKDSLPKATPIEWDKFFLDGNFTKPTRWL